MSNLLLVLVSGARITVVYGEVEAFLVEKLHIE